MQTASELKSAVKNIRYYCEEIHKLARKQLDTDYEFGLTHGINTGAGSIRFDSLAAIDAGASWLGVYCDNIEANLNTAIKQDVALGIVTAVEP